MPTSTRLLTLVSCVSLAACQGGEEPTAPADDAGALFVRAVVADTALRGGSARVVISGHGFRSVYAWRLVGASAESGILDATAPSQRSDTLLALQFVVPAAAEPGNYDVILRYRRRTTPEALRVRRALHVITSIGPPPAGGDAPRPPSPEPDDPPEYCGALCGGGIVLGPGEASPARLYGTLLGASDLRLRIIDAEGATVQGTSLGGIWKVTETSADAWIFVHPPTMPGRYDLEATGGGYAAIVRGFLTIPPSRTVVIDFPADSAFVTLHGQLTNDLRFCAYAWDWFGELLEPCQRYHVRTPGPGMVRAILDWSPVQDWMSLHDERKSALGNAPAPPLVLASPSTGVTGASVVVGIHGTTLTGGWPEGQVVGYELRLEFEPDPGS